MKLKDVALAARQVKAGPADGLAEGEFAAYASVFDVVDSYGDVVVKGAFANTLTAWADSGNELPLLFGHNMSDPDFNIGHVKTAVEDDHGLLVTGVLDLENPKAAQVYRMLKGRRINQMSYAYDVIDGAAAQRDGADVYELRELKLWEVSIVTIGANQETEILAVKSLVDAIAQGTAAGIKAGRTLSAKNETSLRDARDAIDSVLSSLEEDGKSAEPGGTNAQEKASDTADAKSDANDEEPDVAKSSVSDEEPEAAKSSVNRLAAEAHIYALKGAERGSL